MRLINIPTNFQIKQNLAHSQGFLLSEKWRTWATPFFNANSLNFISILFFLVCRRDLNRDLKSLLEYKTGIEKAARMGIFTAVISPILFSADNRNSVIGLAYAFQFIDKSLIDFFIVQKVG
ncbi:hypothetical protein ACLSZ7_07500 [Avibacterium gallinarum]|uniref:hypothetical protein n=1 Tax=Avibacterium gallinarum TaxID=755 RepID=UPI003BF7CB63